MKPTTSKYILVKGSKIHLKGVFAKTDIEAGTKIIEYVGNKLTKKQADVRGDEIMEASNNHKDDGGVYLFEINKKYDIDGSVDWNTAKYINHSCEPNCEAENDKGHIWIIATRDIKKGEELVYNYGYALEDFEDHPCLCGHKGCVGYIVEEESWPKLKKILAKKAKS